MVVQQPATGPAPIHAFADVPRRRRRVRASTIAIGISLAVHAGVGLYIYEWKFNPGAFPDLSDPPMVVPTITLPLPDRPRPEEQRPVSVVHTAAPNQTAPEVTFPVDPPPQTARNTQNDGATDPLSTTPPKPLVIALAEPPKLPHRITNPSWLSQPDARAMSRYYPDRAERMGRAGAATISCVVSANGAVGPCTVLRESPSEFGFGDAALKLSRFFKLAPRTEDGQPVDGGTIEIPIKFQLASG